MIQIRKNLAAVTIGAAVWAAIPRTGLAGPAPDSGTNTNRISGVVTDAAGRPVKGATVEYWSFRVNPLMPDDLERSQTCKTKANGAYEFEANSAFGTVVARKAGLAPAWRQVGTVLKAGPKPGNNLVLTPAGTLAGVLVDESNRPVAKAEVVVESASIEVANRRGGWSYNYLRGQPATDIFAARTDAVGRFLFKDFPTNAIAQLDVRMPGKVLRLMEGDSDGVGLAGYHTSDTNIQLVLEPAGSVEGRVVCSEGASLPVASLRLQAAQPRFRSPKMAKSTAAGTFKFDAVRAGDYRLFASFGTNLMSQWVAPPVPVSVEPGAKVNDVKVSVVRGDILEAMVQGSADHKPVAKVTVSAFSANFQASGQSDSNGVARLLLLPGDYQVAAFNQNRAATQSSATVVAGVTNRVQLEVVAPRKLTGIIRLPDGQPAAGVEVQLIGQYGANEDLIATDAAGKFELDWNPAQFPGQNDETVCLLARDRERNLAVAQDLDEDSAALDLKLAPGLTLFGRAETDGKAITNVTAMLVFWSGNRGMWLEVADTNVTGRYELPALPPGRKYGVVVSAPGYGEKQLNSFEVSAEPGRQELDPVELKPAKLKLSGQVVDADDKPVAGCYVNLNGEDQPRDHVRTDRNGRFAFEHVCEGSVRLYANVSGSYGNVTVEGGDTNVIVRLGQTSFGGSQAHKLKGMVTGPDGQPDGGAKLAVFPNQGGRGWTKAGADGTYNLTWSLQSWQLQNGGAMIVARDTARNLAAVEELPEETTNLDLKLKPAVALTGQVKDETGAAMPGAQVGMWFKAGNSYESFNEQSQPADAEGRFEIKCLPVDGQYIVHATATGYGRGQQTVQAEPDASHLTLDPFVLKRADKEIAGQILNGDDKPVAGINVNLSGDGQPDGNMTTDKQGRFHFKVCDGRIQLFAYSQSGGNAQGTAEAGDTNIVLNLTGEMGGMRPAKPRAALIGNPLPDLTAVGLAADATPAGKPVLLCLFDASQRPSRHTMQLLDKQAAALAQKNVCVLGVQAAAVEDGVFTDWKTASAVSVPIGRVGEKAGKPAWIANVSVLPWLVLADANHKVVAEGFSLDEVDAQIQKLAK